MTDTAPSEAEVVEGVPVTIDGREIEVREGERVLWAALNAGIYIPRLCAHKDLLPFGACRVCTVMVNGRAQAACTTPAAEGLEAEFGWPYRRILARAKREAARRGPSAPPPGPEMVAARVMEKLSR